MCIKQFIADPLTPKVNQLFDHLDNPQTEIFVPDLLYIECANTFWKYVRARMYTAAEVQADLATLKTFPLRVVSAVDLVENAVSIALAYNISAYDASYVALSQQVGATLLTLDQRLVRALGATSYDVCLFNALRFHRCPECTGGATLTYLQYLKVNEQNYHNLCSINTAYLLNLLR